MPCELTIHPLTQQPNGWPMQNMHAQPTQWVNPNVVQWTSSTDTSLIKVVAALERIAAALEHKAVNEPVELHPVKI